MSKIIGVGIDILNAFRIKSMNYKKQIKLAKKILHKTEIKDFKKSKNIYNFLSYRFSIKEAAVKAFGIGIRNGLSLNQIATKNNIYGKPILKFYNNANILYNNLKIFKSHVSLSHDKNIICAIVILES